MAVSDQDDTAPEAEKPAPMDDDAFHKAMTSRLYDGIPIPKDWRTGK